MKKILAACLTISCASCAYKLDESANQFIASNDRAKAVETIRKAFTPHGSAQGICEPKEKDVAKKYKPSRLGAVNDTSFSYTGLRFYDCKDATTSSSIYGTGAMTINFAKTCKAAPAQYTIPFRSVKNLIFQGSAFVDCPTPQGTTTLQVSLENNTVLHANIEIGDLQNVMASFKILNPAISLKKAP